MTQASLPLTTAPTRARRPGWVRALVAAAALSAGLAQPLAAAPHDGHGPAGAHAMHDNLPGFMGEAMGAGMADHMGGMGGGGGGGMVPYRHGERMLDRVGATAEQKAQLKQIMEAARTDLRPLREASRGLQRQMQQLFVQPNVDARAVESLRQQLQANREQSSRRMTQAMLDASRVLTPEQRKQMAERMEQRRGMMQRHRAEREALEGAAPGSPGGARGVGQQP